MSVAERRESIVAAVLPLVHERGVLPSTKEIAQAAGVAEGTIFGVFDDKRALMHAVAERAFAPADGGRELVRAAEAEPDLATRVARVTTLLQERMRTVTAVMMALRPLLDHDGARGPRRGGPPEFVVRANRDLLARLTEVFELDRDALRVEPAVAASLLRSVVFGAHHPGMASTAPLSAEQIADAVLGGVATRAVAAGPVSSC